ncbi:hypothetical protein ACWDRZ_24260 [Streptomyces sp. NPDC003509]
MNASSSHSPLHKPEQGSAWTPPLDMALGLAREALVEQADANVYDKQAMIAAAVQLEIRLRGLVAALDKDKELAAAVAAHGPFPMPAGDTARRVRRFTPLEEAVRNIETAITPLKGDARAGADMVLTYLRTLTTPGAVTEVDRLSDELTGANLALYEEELDNARLRLALASAKRGRREARARVAELEAEREAVLALHRKHTDSDHCFADDETWPCQTRTALDSPDAGTPRLTGLPLGLTGRARHDARVAMETARKTRRRPGACEACGDTDAMWCPDCAACRKGCHGGHDNNDCTHANALWRVAS